MSRIRFPLSILLRFLPGLHGSVLMMNFARALVFVAEDIVAIIIVMVTAVNHHSVVIHVTYYDQLTVNQQARLLRPSVRTLRIS